MAQTNIVYAHGQVYCNIKPKSRLGSAKEAENKLWKCKVEMQYRTLDKGRPMYWNW